MRPGWEATVPRALHALAAQYERQLRGTAEPKYDREVAPLAGLLADEAGWRPDGVLAVRRFLLGALAAYASSTSSSHSRDLHVAAAKLQWGIDAYPQKAPETVTALGLPFSADAVSSWPRQVLDHPAVLDFAVAEIRADGVNVPRSWCSDLRPRVWWPTTVPDLERAGLQSGRAQKPCSHWPPAAWDKGLQANADDEVHRLVDAVSDHLPYQVDERLTVTTLGELAHRPVTEEQCIVDSLRVLVAPHLLAWFKDASDSEHEIYVRNRVFKAWFHDDVLAALLPDGALLASAGTGKIGRGLKYGRAVAAAAQMLMWEATEDIQAVVSTALARGSVALGALLLSDLDPLAGFGPSLERLASTGRLALFGLHTAEGRDRLILPTADAGTLAGTARHLALSAQEMTPRSALEAAASIRSVSDPAVKRRLIDDYLRQRAQFSQRARSDEEHALLALADQSAHWDTVTLEDEALARRFERAVRAQPARAKWGYLSHTSRCLAVLANKQDDWQRGFGYVAQGLRDLAELSSWSFVHDAIEREESAQQVYLAGAGIAVRRLERALLLAPAGRSEVVAQAARAALWLSTAALASLQWLEEQHLPGRRHDGLRISFSGWRAQSRIMRLRALVGVRTAILARLVDERALMHNRDASNGATVSTDVPFHPLVVPRSITADLDLAGILTAYRELQHIPEVGRDKAREVVPVALWVALLNGGMLPTEDNPSLAFVEASEFLAREDHEQDLAEIPLRIHEAARWLQRNQTDALVLSWLEPNTVARNALNQASGGAYEQFRAAHDRSGRPQQAGHD